MTVFGGGGGGGGGLQYVRTQTLMEWNILDFYFMHMIRISAKLPNDLAEALRGLLQSVSRTVVLLNML
jgi:hypothetical protein